MLKLSIVTPEKILVEDLEVDSVLVPGHRGELDILPDHAPLITTLNTGILTFKEKDNSKEEVCAISWGYCEVAGNEVSILAETAERPEEIEMARVEQALKKSQDFLDSDKVNADNLDKYRSKVKRAEVRLEVAKLKK